MAEGCNLYNTYSNQEQIREAIRTGPESNARKSARDVASGMLLAALEDHQKGFIKALNDKNHFQHNFTKTLIVKSLGENKVTKQEEDKLPSALHSILKDHPDPQGLFIKPPKNRGPGSSKMSHPYELLSTAALAQREVTSSLGKKLKIYSTDRLDFGQKLASNYALSTRKKNTFEADTLIRRDDSEDGSSKIIGIDAKYTHKSHYDIIRKNDTEPDLERQLKGIRKGFWTKELDEFYFVSNVKFGGDFKELVNEYNYKIFKDNIDELKSSYKDKNLSQMEIDKMPKIDDLYTDFKKNPKKARELAEKYDIPQIGLCEEVNYEGP